MIAHATVCGLSVDNPVENMGPGRCGPVLLQCGGEKGSSDAKPKIRLQAMRVRAAVENIRSVAWALDVSSRRLIDFLLL